MLPLDLEPEWIKKWTIILDKSDKNGLGWALKEGAPPEIKIEFENYIKTYMDGCQEE